MFNNLLTDWSSPLDNQRNELVFENRNKAYGAYIIRRDYDRALLIAFFSATLFLVGLLYANTLFGKTHVIKKIIEDGTVIVQDYDITPPPKNIKPIDPPIATPAISKPAVAPPVATSGTSIANLILDNHPVTITTPIVNDGHANPNANPNPNPTVDPIPHEPATNPTGGNNIGSVEPPILNPQNVDVMPSPIGGDDQLYAFINKHIKYPQDALVDEKEGRVMIQFVIEEDGSVSNVSVLKGVFGSLDKEAMRVIKLLPKWNPGMSGGKPARVYFRMPISFHISN